MTDTYDKENHWYGWNGGECPVHPKTRIEMMLRSGERVNGWGKFEDWTHDDYGRDIIAFRIVELYHQPREWWIVRGTSIKFHGIFTKLSDAEDYVNGEPNYDIVHVREVLEIDND